MDAPTISAIAAGIAATVAATVAAIQFYIGQRQAEAALISAKAALMNAQNAGVHTVAEFRQNWIDKVTDALCEHQSILITRDAEFSPEVTRRLIASRARIEILLNPDEPDTVELLNRLDELGESDVIGTKDAADALMVARRLLKREWARIKEELGAGTTGARP
jgi:hypothetical protein